MDKEKLLLKALNTFGNFTNVEQEFNYNQLEVIYEAMNQVLHIATVSGLLPSLDDATKVAVRISEEAIKPPLDAKEQALLNTL